MASTERDEVKTELEMTKASWEELDCRMQEVKIALQRKEEEKLEVEQAQVEEHQISVQAQRKSDTLVDHLMESIGQLKLEQESQELEWERAAERKDTELTRMEKRLERYSERVHDLERTIKSAKAREARIPHKISQAVEREVDLRITYHTKSKNMFKHEIYSLVTDLVTKCNIPEAKVPETLKMFSKHFGIKILGGISEKSVRRIIKTVGMAGKMQNAEMWKNAHERGDGIVLSTDSGTERNRGYNLINYSTDGETQLLGIAGSTDHSSVSQANRIQSKMKGAINLYNHSPEGSRNPIDIRDIFRTLTGGISDHASDVRKVFSIIRDRKKQADRELRGEAVYAKMNVGVGVQALAEEYTKLVEDVGEEVWGLASEEDQEELKNKVRVAFMQRLGEEDFEKLPVREQKSIDLFLWTGCGAHKDLNAVKQGVAGQQAYWNRQEQEERPVKFLDRRAYELIDGMDDTPGVREKEEEKVESGGAKHVRIFGAIVKNRDPGMGIQAQFGIFFEAKLGYIVTFPGVNATRYQSLCEGALVIYYFKEEMLELLDAIHDWKDRAGRTIAEKNIRNGLLDKATITDLISMAVYHEAVSAPFHAKVRPMTSERLELGALYTQLKTYLKSIVDNPYIIIGDDAQPITFNGHLWNRPELLYKLLSEKGEYPHLNGNLIAFFTGVLKGWEHFTAEYAQEEPICQASAEDLQRARGPATNDRCEGEMGDTRQALRRAPNISLSYHEAKEIAKKNPVGPYLMSLDWKTVRYLAKETRQADESGEEKQRRADENRQKQKRIQERREQRSRAERRNQEFLEKLDAVILRPDTAEILTNVKNKHGKGHRWQRPLRTPCGIFDVDCAVR